MDIANLIVALGFLGFTRERDALKDERNFRREEAFVPFKLPPLPEQEQPIGESVMEGRPGASGAVPTSHALSA